MPAPETINSDSRYGWGMNWSVTAWTTSDVDRGNETFR